MIRFLVFALMASFLMGLAVSAQQGMTLSGTVQDQDGGVIPGAKVTLTNSTTGEIRDAVADDGGGFRFENLAPGKYSLKGKAKGFAATELEITIGAEAPAPIKLKLGINLKEEVTITDNQTEQTISPEANADAINMTSDFLKTLPAQSDDILPIVGNFLSTSAQGTEGLTVVVDGVEGTALNVPTDAIRRVIINRNPYSSSFRRPGEGRVEVITKDGSRRRYDGTFSYMVRNAFFDSRDTITRRYAKPNPNLDRRLFSATFGGPVPKWKKATFFFSANDLVNNQDVGIDATTPAGKLVENVPTTKHRLNLLSRVDWRPNAVHTVSARFYYYRSPETNKGLTVPFALPEQGYDSFAGGERFMFSDRAIVSATLLNELSVNFSMDNIRDGKKPDSPMLVVRGDFIGGPSQVNNKGSDKLLDVQDFVTYTRGNHTLHFGGGLRTRFSNSVNETNFVGTYFFQGLLDYLDRSPSGFQVYQGQSKFSFSQYEAFGFIEAEIKLRRWFSITPGLRYDWFSSINDHNNFGPRLSFALAPGKEQKTVLRGGAGIFYERLSGSVMQQTFTDGSSKKLVDISNPSYPNPFSAGNRRPPTPPSRWQLAPDLAAPYMVMGSLSLERRLWGRSQVSVEYQRLHGVHLFRARDINAPLDQFGFIGRRPNPNFRLIDQVESSASSRSSALKVTFQGRIGKIFRGMAQYTHSRTTDDTDGPLVKPENNYELGRELGRSDFDQRHRFSYAGTLDLPFAFRLGTVLIVASGIPYDITTAYDDNGDRNFRDRPIGVTRNTGKGPPIAQLDLRLTKLFRLPTPFSHKAGKSDLKLKNLEFSFDAFNVFNRPNAPVVIGQLKSGVYGQATTTNMARTLQLSLKYSF